MNTLQSKSAEPRNEFEEHVARLDPWFHNLHLPGGQTAPEHPLGDFPRFKWEQIAPHLPESLEGWTALDVGCNAGFYSFELARRGAKVKGIDVDEHYLNQAAWAARQLDLREQTRFAKQSVYEAGQGPEQYDLVWFMGVFYHLRYPVLALDFLARKAKRLFVFQSLSLPQSQGSTEAPENLVYEKRQEMRAENWPTMALVERRFAGDPTNWWVANPAALEALLRTAGLRVIARPDEETFICRPEDPDKPTEKRQLAREEMAAVRMAFDNARSLE